MLCPAKINLGLKIYHRRPSDGFHYLGGLFIPISFGDEMELSLSDEDCIVTENLLPDYCRADFEAVSERGDITRNLLWKLLKK